MLVIKKMVVGILKLRIMYKGVRPGKWVLYLVAVIYYATVYPQSYSVIGIILAQATYLG